MMVPLPGKNNPGGGFVWEDVMQPGNSNIENNRRGEAVTGRKRKEQVRYTPTAANQT